MKASPAAVAWPPLDSSKPARTAPASPAVSSAASPCRLMPIKPGNAFKVSATARPNDVTISVRSPRNVVSLVSPAALSMP